MYTRGIYIAFVQLRKQYYKLKTRAGNDRYSRIESYEKDYKTFRAFCDAILEYNCYCSDYNNCIDVQDTFDDLLVASQNNTLKYLIQ